MSQVPQRQIFVCMKAVEPEHCAFKGAGELLAAIGDAIRDRGHEGRVSARPGPCLSVCEEGPALICYDGEKRVVKGPVKGLRAIFIKEHGAIVKNLEPSQAASIVEAPLHAFAGNERQAAARPDQ